MTTDKKRYDLCIRCLQEHPYSPGSFAAFLDDVKALKEKKRKWTNPRFGKLKYDARKFTYTVDSMKTQVDELCPGCPYVLEHMAYTGKVMKEVEPEE